MIKPENYLTDKDLRHETRMKAPIRYSEMEKLHQGRLAELLKLVRGHHNPNRTLNPTRKVEKMKPYSRKATNE